MPHTNCLQPAVCADNCPCSNNHPPSLINAAAETAAGCGIAPGCIAPGCMAPGCMAPGWTMPCTAIAAGFAAAAPTAAPACTLPFSTSDFSSFSFSALQCASTCTSRCRMAGHTSTATHSVTHQHRGGTCPYSKVARRSNTHEPNCEGMRAGDAGGGGGLHNCWREVSRGAASTAGISSFSTKTQRHAGTHLHG